MKLPQNVILLLIVEAGLRYYEIRGVKTAEIRRESCMIAKSNIVRFRGGRESAKGKVVNLRSLVLMGEVVLNCPSPRGSVSLRPGSRLAAIM